VRHALLGESCRGEYRRRPRVPRESRGDLRALLAAVNLFGLVRLQLRHTADAWAIAGIAAGPRKIDRPAPPGSLLDESLSIAGSTLVDAIVFDDGAAHRVRWTSDDRHTWSLAS